MKPQINSFYYNLAVRSSSSTMNSNASTNAGQSASSEAKAAEAASNLDMELEDPNIEYEYDPNSPLKDYNEDDEDPVPALERAPTAKKPYPPKIRR